MGEIKKIVNLIKDEHGVAYKYSLAAQYPNDESDQVAGNVYIGTDEDKIMYNSCDAFTMIYTGKWFYRADHRNKTVLILNLEKNFKKDFKSDLEHDIFQNGTAGMFLDSIVMKHARIQTLKKEGDTVNVELSFPENSMVRELNIVYNDREKMLISYRMRTFQPWKTNEFGKNKGTTQTVSCSGFETVKDNNKYGTGNFFSVKKGKAVLKKYSKYKLNSKL